jgi:hypothetical protein
VLLVFIISHLKMENITGWRMAPGSKDERRTTTGIEWITPFKYVVNCVQLMIDEYNEV